MSAHRRNSEYPLVIVHYIGILFSTLPGFISTLPNVLNLPPKQEMLGFVYLVHIYGVSFVRHVAKAIIQTEAFISEVISLKKRLEREIGVSGENIVLTVLFASTASHPGNQRLQSRVAH